MIKKFSSLLLIALFSSTVCISAAEKADDFKKHELSVSYGYFPVTEWAGAFGKALLFPILTVGTVHEDQNSTFSGAINLDYNCRLNKRVGVGVGVSYAYGKGSVTYKILGTESSYPVYNNYLSIMPKVKLNWINLRVFTLYSVVGLGLTMDFYNSTTTNDNREVVNNRGTDFMFAYQVSPIGMEFGKNVCFFMEAGIGTSGTLIGGVRGKF